MELVRNAVNIVNHGQTPVISCDQPHSVDLVRDTWGDSYVVMLGCLHIKMTLLKYIGDLLNRSGWTSAISQANIATSGTAESFLKASDVKKTARAHQVTAHMGQSHLRGKFSIVICGDIISCGVVVSCS